MSNIYYRTMNISLVLMNYSGKHIQTFRISHGPGNVRKWGLIPQAESVAHPRVICSHVVYFVLYIISVLLRKTPIFTWRFPFRKTLILRFILSWAKEILPCWSFQILHYCFCNFFSTYWKRNKDIFYSVSLPISPIAKQEQPPTQDHTNQLSASRRKFTQAKGIEQSITVIFLELSHIFG